MPNKTLFAWIGRTDIKASQGGQDVGLGPIGQAVSSRTFSHIILISNYNKKEENRFVAWLKGITSAEIFKYHMELSSPTDFKEIYEAAIKVISDSEKKIGVKELHKTYHLSPGTPAMAAVWIILSKTTHPAELIESSQERGVTVSYTNLRAHETVLDIVCRLLLERKNR